MYIKEIFDFDVSRYRSYTGKPLKGDDIARPCGLHAKAMLNDTFALFNKNTGKEIKISTTDIANKYDKETVYGRWDNSTETDWYDTTDGTLLFILYFISKRTFYCLDANGDLRTFQKVMG